MKTGSHLKIRPMGDSVLGVELEGNPKRPEPIHFRVVFPGGDVDVVRTTDGDYWVHVRTDIPEHRIDFEGPTARIVNARLDIHGQSVSEVNIGDFNSPGLYHVAFRIKKGR